MQQPICRKASSIIHKKDLNYNEYSFGLERETKNIINRGFPTIAKYILKGIGEFYQKTFSGKDIIPLFPVIPEIYFYFHFKLKFPLELKPTYVPVLVLK